MLLNFSISLWYFSAFSSFLFFLLVRNVRNGLNDFLGGVLGIVCLFFQKESGGVVFLLFELWYLAFCS